jgi:hypothetical protein
LGGGAGGGEGHVMFRKVVTVVVAVAVRINIVPASTFTLTAIIVSGIIVSNLFVFQPLLWQLKLSNEVKLDADEEPYEENSE